MPKCAVRGYLPVLILFTISLLSSAAAQDSPASPSSPPRPLRASEVMALQAGAALPANISYDIEARGLNFAPDAHFLALMRRAGADASVIAALKRASVNGEGAAMPDRAELLRALADAAVLMKGKKYAEAGTKLGEALDTSFARLETGFVMAALLCQQGDFERAHAVYAQIIETEPDFPEVHDKAGYVLYRLGEENHAISEAKVALALNPNDAEAHKNEALALSQDHRFDAAIAEFNEALRIKPDYAEARSGLGQVYAQMQDYPNAIAEYKKAIAIDPHYDDAHNNLGLAYSKIGMIGAAILEFREARRLSPNVPDFRQNLASALMGSAPAAALRELKELEAKFPNFQVCHSCLGNGLLWAGDVKGAEAEYLLAITLDPADAAPHKGLGDIQTKRRDYDAALAEYRIAQRLAPEKSDAYQGAGQVLLERKDYDGAAVELKQAVTLAPGKWEVHEIYAKALIGAGQTDLAIAEFKEAIRVGPKQGYVITELGGALEKKGDWVGALEQYRKGALTDARRAARAEPGHSYLLWETNPRKEYQLAKVRFANYLVSLRVAGKTEEAAELEKRVGVLNTSGSTRQKLQGAMQAGEQAIREHRFDDAVKSFQEAVALGQKLPPGDENLIRALGRLGNAYAFQEDYTDAEQAFHQEMSVIAKAFGPRYPRMTDPLFFLGSIEAKQKHFDVAESYFTQALDIKVRHFGENSAHTVEVLRWIAGLHMAQEDWAGTEPFLLRAVRAAEGATRPDDKTTLVPLYGLCNLYDRWDKPDKAQPCWQRAIGIMEKQMGENSPDLREPLTADAQALRKLGRTDEAGDIEQRLEKIQKVAASN